MSSNSITNESDTFEIGETTVHRLGFGAMRITGEDIIGAPDDEAAAREVVEHAVDCGVDLIDTADSYGPATSERLIGEAIGDPDDVLVATKAGLLRNREGDWLAHGDPDYIRNQVLTSLDRLRTDTIDLYQFHRPDDDTPFEDSVAAFAELKDEGLVDQVGLSNVSPELIDQAREQIEVATVQNRYNLNDRGAADSLEVCAENDIGFIPWAPINGDDLAEHGDLLDEIAETHDATRRQIALAWLLERSPVILPIPGTSDPDHLESNVAASQLSLSDDEVQRLTDAAE
ncbi:aldo/keto reductase [Natrinema pellirubrum DSM 15624]|uniref:Aldo/keto reductase n=1 Tax=Natrinema pellirubrum (strain DSM 15624 / CIP 106293 / JCM 10476 / NCIMB 786 / 157) TaxID=797303 RepID=L0JRC6_NATP1|nr:aldo/keto reductase [Natrinema pellirubrum]AGB33187.1 putative oxidoreductase, aryl-alcohol dehydrogenase like protein [Natrinema pellirubrum DSM 15624]ELY71852.1 aldo/keto reductase [Natrinema pellirubrum DSM 15624]